MSRDPALARFVAIQAVRLAGIALVVFGALVMAGRVDGPALGGFLLASAGLIASALFPRMLARRWRRRGE